MHHNGARSLPVLRKISFLQLAHSRDDMMLEKKREKKRGLCDTLHLMTKQTANAARDNAFVTFQITSNTLYYYSNSRFPCFLV